jgi:hypothetical protein
MARELHAATRRLTETMGPPPGEQPDRRLAGKTRQAPSPSPPVAKQPERFPRQAEVVELEAPAQQRRAPAERAATPAPIRADVARPPTTTTRQAELAVAKTGTDRVRERAVPARAPRREANLERTREATVRSPKPSIEPTPTRRSRAEPFPAVELPWPELPPPLDTADDDEVEAALRAWEHRRRIDREQTRL